TPVCTWLQSEGKMTDLCEPCEGSSLGSEPQESTTSPGAPTTSKHASPSVSELILWAVATSPKCQGLSLEALKKIITKAGYDVTHFKRVLLSLVTKGLLQKLKGTGASGSFGIGKEMAKKMSAGHKKKKAPKKRQRPLKVGIAATSLAERGQLLTMDLLRNDSPKGMQRVTGRARVSTQVHRVPS
uniref:H15 domain-containing protein n=1 Tax=Gopherus evgoodei TaxID=1825980 RepID=A0A8C4WK52_9SAUR